MPSFKTLCPGCGKKTRVIRDERPELVPCSCGETPVYVSGISTQVKEVYDNGIMPRKVEQLKDVEQLLRDRGAEKKDPGIV